MSESGNRVVVQRFLEEVINQGRLEQANEIVAEDFIELDPCRGRDRGARV